jgi:methylenetetrahydrofolate reductase (NADPH)
VTLNAGPAAKTARADYSNFRVSCIFSPKGEKMKTALWDYICKREPHHPDFLSVTYRRGGLTRVRTHRSVSSKVQKKNLRPAEYLTCAAPDVSEVIEIAIDYWDGGVRHMVAIQGDTPEGTGRCSLP